VEVSSLQPTDDVIPSGDVLSTELDVEAPTESVAEEPTMTQHDFSTAQPDIANESDLPLPAERVVAAETPLEQIMTVEEPIPVDEPVPETVTFQTSKKKGKKNKGKESVPYTPAFEVDDPIVAEASGVPEDLQRAPVTVVEPEAQVLDIAPIEDTPRTEGVVESVDVEEPISRKLSKKEKKKAKSSILDEESIVEIGPSTKEVVEQSALIPEFIETVSVEGTRQTPLDEESQPQPPTPVVDLEATHEAPEQRDSSVNYAALILMDEQRQRAVLEEDSTLTPKKGKKAKKDQKSKKQSESLDTALDVESKPSGVPERAADVDKLQTEPAMMEPTPVVESEHAPNNTQEMGLLSSIGIAAKSIFPLIFQTEDSSAPPIVDTKDVPDQPLENYNTSQEAVTTEQPEVLQGLKADDVVRSVSPVVGKTGETPAPATITEDKQLVAPTPLESAERELPLGSTTNVQLEAPTLAESTRRDLLHESAPATLPATEPIDDALAQPSEAEQTLEPSVSAPIKQDEAEAAGLPTSTKQSKTDKKEAKKNSSASEVATPSETALEPTTAAQADVTEPIEPTIIEETSHDVRIEEPQAVVEEFPPIVQLLPENLSTPIAEAMLQDKPEALEATQGPEVQPIEFEAPEMPSSPSTSKKSKKKRAKEGQKAIEDADSELLTPATLISETPPVLQDASLGQLPIESPTEKTQIELEQGPVSSTREARSIDATQSESVAVVIEQSPVEPDHNAIKLAVEADVDAQSSRPQERLVVPLDLSPTLKATQDEAFDLKLRSEALDRTLAANEPLDLAPPSQPVSFFDVASKLSKKEKKKAKKGKGSALDSEPTTPAPEPKVAVETKDMVEDPISASEMQQPIFEQYRDETGVAFPPTISELTAEPEIAAASVQEVDQTPLQEMDDIVNTVQPVALNESQDAAVEEQRPSSSRTLSKKGKKKAKQMAVPEVLPEAEVATPHTPDKSREVVPAGEPALDPVVSETTVTADASEHQPAVMDEEQRPSLSRKMSKKGKKKQAKTTALAQETIIPKTTDAISTYVVVDSANVDVPTPVEEQQDIPVEEPSPVSREPGHIVEHSNGLPASSELDSKMEEVTFERTPAEPLPTMHNPEAFMSVDDLLPVSTSHDDKTTTTVGITSVTEPEVVTTESEQFAMVDMPSKSDNQETTIGGTDISVPEVSEYMDTSASTSKQGKKDKKKGKKKAVVDGSAEAEHVVDVEMAEVTHARDAPADLLQSVSTTRARRRASARSVSAE
jgi:hypothetical protein